MIILMRMILYNNENPVLILNLFNQTGCEHLILPTYNRYDKIIDCREKMAVVEENMNKSDIDHTISSISTEVTILTIFLVL